MTSSSAAAGSSQQTTSWILRKMGVTRIFTPGASTRDIVDFAQKSILREAGQLSIPEQPKEALK